MTDTRGVVRLGMPSNQKPDENSLQRLLVQYCQYWRSIGLELGLPSSLLGQVESQYNSLTERFRVTLDKWLQMNDGVTWGKLELAITNANRVNLGLDPLTRIPTRQGDDHESRNNNNVEEQQANNNITENLQNQDGDDDIDDGGAQSEGKKKKKKFKESIYPVISRSNRPCAIIINNRTFAPKPELVLKERSWSISDKEKILTLEKEFGMKFIQFDDHTAQQMKEKLASAVDPQYTYSGLLVFIMTHGGSGDMLYGSDSEPIALTELSKFFEEKECPALTGKPKIFILHYCRGPDYDLAHREGNGGASGSHPRYAIPQKADFLFVHSTTDGYVAYGHRKKGFIPNLVDVFTEKLNENHLEDVLLIVKRQVADIEYKCDDGEYYKQMPSVVSQMRDKVWFDKE